MAPFGKTVFTNEIKDFKRVHPGLPRWALNPMTGDLIGTEGRHAEEKTKVNKDTSDVPTSKGSLEPPDTGPGRGRV